MDGWITAWREEKRLRSRRRSFFLFCAALLLLFVGAGWGMFSLPWKKVALEVDGQEKLLRTRAKTVEQVLAEEGVTLAPEDEVNPPLLTPVTRGLRIQVKRAVPVRILVDGGEREIRLVPGTVGQALERAGVHLGPLDRVEPADTEKLVEPGETIKVIRVEVKTEMVEEEVGYQVIRRQDPGLEIGTTRVLQQGRKGLKRIEYRVTYEDGAEVKREVVKEEIVREPVPQVIVVGTLREVSRGGYTLRFRQALWVTATAYTHTGNRTATGTVPRLGTVAVDPQVIPLGSRLYIEGYGFGRAEDVGSSIRGERIDVFFESLEATRRWGVRRVKVYILE
ncbi:MAG: ubiquitin-like domain-containing protein [Thermanaeromonas sp.]|uniref:ubiquitin-like domain-containing protein n=1 Tax=Thermanaeromonas sp. TaxID=2003697 RepID=UPI00244091FC|nr:ubiquitin-like domain-containing protein [Thermanaeromonas sp.]MCG0277347.1 ubiquitin-like domain-containing protein [Thermanaeromonas sp.]